MVIDPSRPPRGRPRRRVPRFPVRKAFGRVSSRTALHSDFLLVCEYDPAVIALGDAREALALPGGVLHVPDYRVVTASGAVLVDVLASDQPEAAARLRAVAQAAAASGVPYRVETNATVCAEPRLTAARLIDSCRRRRVPPDDRVRILHALTEAGSLPLVEVAALASGSLEAVATVLALVCEGLVEIEIDDGIVPEALGRRRRTARGEP